QTLSLPGCVVYSARFSPDGRQIATASGKAKNGYLWLWDCKEAAYVEIDRQIGAEYACASFSTNRNHLVAGLRDAQEGVPLTAQVWDLASKKPVGDPIRHKSWLFHAVFSPDGHRVATASYDGSTQVCDADTGHPIFPALKH